MAKNWRPIYIKDILNLYDYNRDGQKPWKWNLDIYWLWKQVERSRR